MMIKQVASITLSFCLVSSACTSEITLDQKAHKVCSCLQPVDSLNQLLANKIQEGRQDEAVEVLLDLSEASELSRQCVKAIDKGFSVDPDKVLADRLDIVCPGWHAILEVLPLEDEL